MFQRLLSLLICFGFYALTSGGTAYSQSSACNTKNVSKPFVSKLGDFQRRLNSPSSDKELLLSEVQAAGKGDLNCYEQLILSAVKLEVIAFSDDPVRSIPALEILYENYQGESGNRLRLNNIMNKLGESYARTGRTQKLQTMLDRYPNTFHRLNGKLLSGLALAYAQNGDTVLAKATSLRLLETNKKYPSEYDYMIAIAVHDLARDTDKSESLRIEAAEKFGELDWSSNKDEQFEFIYRKRFGASLGSTDGANISRKDANPLNPPRVKYPKKALKKRVQGHCQVYFDVSAKGETERVEALCTSELLESAAGRAVEKVRFEPAQIDGVPHKRYNVIYPISFSINN